LRRQRREKQSHRHIITEACRRNRGMKISFWSFPITMILLNSPFLKTWWHFCLHVYILWYVDYSLNTHSARHVSI
jgi:hypothetical protein